jgi:hypothetical protein
MISLSSLYPISLLQKNQQHAVAAGLRGMTQLSHHILHHHLVDVRLSIIMSILSLMIGGNKVKLIFLVTTRRVE